MVAVTARNEPQLRHLHNQYPSNILYGVFDAADQRHKNGLEEWQNLLEHPEAATLRAVLEGDIQTAQDLIDGKVDLKALAGSKA